MFLFLITISPLILFLLYKCGTRNYNYWKNRGVKHEKPVPFLGTYPDIFLQKIGYADLAAKIYNDYPNENMVGYFIGNHERLLLRDPHLIKQIMTTDFHYFYARGIIPHKDFIEPMMKNIFFADGDLWKLLRQRITPAFTSGKLKAMFPLIVERAEKLQRIALKAAESNEEVDVKDLMARYTTDFIGACGFGIETDSLNSDSSAFRELGKIIFTVTKLEALKAFLKLMFVDTFKKLHFLKPEIERDAVRLVKSIMKQRGYKYSGRNDFVDQLLQLKEKGMIIGESIEKMNEDGTPAIVELELDDLLITAQLLVFFVAGFETSSSSTSYTLHLLAYHPAEQRKCQEEIDEVLKKYGGKLCYDAINEMKYLDMCFKESMRIYPSLGSLTRRAVHRYTFPGTKVTIDEGVVVNIPVLALHNDPQYFPEPQEFRPERFHPDNLTEMQKSVYMPFGNGPRACVGERLGRMQSLAGLAAVLRACSVSVARRSVPRPRTDPASKIVQLVQGGLPLALTNRGTAPDPLYRALGVQGEVGSGQESMN